MQSRRVLVLAIIAAAALPLGACGSSKKSSSKSSSSSAPASLSLQVAQAGKAAKVTAPATTKGGLVKVTLSNRAKAPHAVQFVLVKGNHSLATAYKLVNSNSNTPPPSWLRAEGGVSTTAPGATNTATVNLPAGKYLVTESGGGPGSSGPPFKAQMSVTGGAASASLPSTSASITAAAAGKDHYRWQISGLHAGRNEFTFKSGGTNTFHFVGAVRIKPGQNPSLAEIQKSFRSNGPPKFADLTSFASTAVLDSGKSQVTTLNLKAGTYAFFCPLTDRDGGKPHIAEGLLTKYTVK
jgi:hypothetical protein